METTLRQDLEALGLNGRQSSVYLALLRLGPAGAIEIAKRTKLKHPTVYDVLDVLKERALVSEALVNGRKLFTAESPEAFRLAEEQRQTALSRMLPELLRMYQNGAHRPGVRCFYGVEAHQAVHRELLSCRSREYFYFGQASVSLKRSGLEYEQEYFRQRLARGIRSNAIRVRESEREPEFMRGSPENLRRVRYITRPFSAEIADLYLYDEKVLIYSTQKEDYAVLIESIDLFTLLRNIWDIIWDIAAEER